MRATFKRHPAAQASASDAAPEAWLAERLERAFAAMQGQSEHAGASIAVLIEENPLAACNEAASVTAPAPAAPAKFTT